MATISYSLMMEIIGVAETYAKNEKKRLRKLGKEQAKAKRAAQAEPKTER